MILFSCNKAGLFFWQRENTQEVGTGEMGELTVFKSSKTTKNSGIPFVAHQAGHDTHAHTNAREQTCTHTHTQTHTSITVSRRLCRGMGILFWLAALAGTSANPHNAYEGGLLATHGKSVKRLYVDSASPRLGRPSRTLAKIWLDKEGFTHQSTQCWRQTQGKN